VEADEMRLAYLHKLCLTEGKFLRLLTKGKNRMIVLTGARGSRWVVSTTRNMLIYDEFFVTISKNVINMHDL
jgi:hypothetical protein